MIPVHWVLRGAVVVLAASVLLSGACGSPERPSKRAFRLAKTLAGTTATLRHPSAASDADLFHNPTDTERVPNGGDPALRYSASLLRAVADMRVRPEPNPSPANVRTLHRAIERYREWGMWFRAQQLTEALIRVQPENPLWQLLSGQIHAHLGRIDRRYFAASEKALRAARKAPETKIRASVSLGSLYVFRLNRRAKGRRLLQRVLQGANPHFRPRALAQARFALGKLEYQNQNLQAAKDVIEPVLGLSRLAPRQRFKALTNLGRIHEAMDEPAEARSFYSKALRLQPHNDRVRRALIRLGSS